MPPGLVQQTGVCASTWEADEGKVKCGASSVIIAACSVALILDSLILAAWVKEGCNELKVVKMGATGL